MSEPIKRSRADSSTSGATQHPQSIFSKATEAAGVLGSKSTIRPEIGIICGSGLGGLADLLENKVVVEYTDVPHLPQSTVPGHSGKFVIGYLSGKPTIVMQGRFHPYEGYDLSVVTLPVRIMRLLGVSTLIVTNAAGGLNPEFAVGDIMIIEDHLNFPGLAGNNPLFGHNEEEFGPRFPPMSNAYDETLRELLKKTAEDLGYSQFLREGVYTHVAGPSFETAAECRFLIRAGGDAVGMSTVPEVIVARHCGLRVVGISLITNKCVTDMRSANVANHEEVLATGRMRTENMQTLVNKFVANLTIPQHGAGMDLTMPSA